MNHIIQIEEVVDGIFSFWIIFRQIFSWHKKMDIELFDLLRYEQVEYLTVGEILKLCRSNKEFSTICKSQDLWKYLIMRDFGDHVPKYVNKVYERYKMAYSVHKSDIPLENVILQAEKFQVKLQDVEKILETLGFKRKGANFIFSNSTLWIAQRGKYVYGKDILHIQRVFKYTNAKYTNIKYIEDVLKVIEAVLPQIVSISYHPHQFEIEKPVIEEILYYYKSLVQ